jgi:molecular chaperone HscB
VKLQDDDFTLFALPRQQALDRARLDAAWRQLQSTAHPDRFAADGAAQQRMAMQWAVRINEAYQRLKDPLSRAAYLCELQGVAVDAERNTAMPASFLVQQMQWREDLDEARGLAEVQALEGRVAQEERDQQQALLRLLDAENKPQQAVAHVRALMFVRRFRQDIDKRLDALEAGANDPMASGAIDGRA